jgi:hypothetical protein
LSYPQICQLERWKKKTRNREKAYIIISADWPLEKGGRIKMRNRKRLYFYPVPRLIGKVQKKFRERVYFNLSTGWLLLEVE